MRIVWLMFSIIHVSSAEKLFIECCDIWTSVNQFIAVKTGEDISPCPVPCKTYPGIAKFVMNISPMLRHHDDALNGSTYFIPHEDIFPSNKVSDVLAWSIVGRLCSTHPSDQQVEGKYIQFEPSTGDISVVHAGCEYQRSMYSTLLSLCIILVIFLLTSIVARKPKQKPSPIAACITTDTVYEPISQVSHRLGTRTDFRCRTVI